MMKQGDEPTRRLKYGPANYLDDADESEAVHDASSAEEKLMSSLTDSKVVKIAAKSEASHSKITCGTGTPRSVYRNTSPLPAPGFISVNNSRGQQHRGIGSSGELLDSKITAKIVQERLRGARSFSDVTEDTDKQKNENLKKTGAQKDVVEISATTAPMPPPMEGTDVNYQVVHQDAKRQLVSTNSARTHQSDPGAVCVAGINSAAQHSADFNPDLEENTVQTPLANSTSDVLIEATLVKDSTRRSLYESSPSDQLFVEAQPMDESFSEYPQQEVQLKDVLKSKKLCCKIAIVMCLVAAFASAMAVGFVTRRENDHGDSDDSSSQDTGNSVSIYPPFSDEINTQTTKQIMDFPDSPAARANQWLLDDPNFQNYTRPRKFNRFVLATLYYSTTGDDWYHNDNWLDYNTHECDWYSSHPEPFCASSFAVNYLNLSSNNLQGTVPAEMRYIDTHKGIDLSHNRIFGMPPPMGHGAQMEAIIMSHNQLSGQITADLGWSNPQLKILRLDHNQLSGSIPPQLTTLIPTVLEIDISNNLLSGTIPDDFLATSPLRLLSFANNSLVGTFPFSVPAHLPHLEHMDVSGNAGLTGKIPSNDWKSMNITFLDISGTSITGAVPEELCLLEDLGQLQIEANCSMVECCSR